MLVLLTGCTWIDEDAFAARLADPASVCTPTAEVEVCNNIDDDCVGGVDDGLPLYYVDADNDTFGDAADPGDCATIGVEDHTDCDDASSATYPGAREMCDGVENDCDPTSVWVEGDEDGLVASLTDGTWADLSSSFDDAVASEYPLAGGRTYYFCAGTYNTRLTASGITVDVVGVYGAHNTVIDSSTSATPKETFNSNGGYVHVTGLTITGGSGADTGTNQFGGGVYATALYATAPMLTLTDCIIDNNTADYGGGLSVSGYAWVVLDGTTVSNNTAEAHGGGVYVSTTGFLEVTAGSYIGDNVATGNGGGIYAAGSGAIEVDASTIRLNSTPTTGSTSAGDGGAVYVTNGTLTLTNGSAIPSNTAGDDAGAIYIDDGTVHCTDSFIYANDSARGAVFLANYNSATATFTAANCDLGSGGLDNEDYDITVKANASSHTDLTGYGAGATFTCTSTSDTCSPLP